MNYQAKLEKASKGASYKLFDNNIKITGKPTTALRLRLEKDVYGDLQEWSIIKQDSISLTISYPDDIPLSRFRNDNHDQTKVASTGIFLFDVLPIEVYSKWADDIEVGDYLIDIMIDERGNQIKIPLVLTEITGSFGINVLKYKKLRAAVYNDGFDPEIQAIINGLKLDEDLI